MTAPTCAPPALETLETLRTLRTLRTLETIARGRDSERHNPESPQPPPPPPPPLSLSLSFPISPSPSLFISLSLSLSLRARGRVSSDRTAALRLRSRQKVRERGSAPKGGRHPTICFILRTFKAAFRILKTHLKVTQTFGRGDDAVGNPHRAQIYEFELFGLILLSKLKQLPVEQFEATVSQSTVPSPLLIHTAWQTTVWDNNNQQ